ncbi:Aldo/keto reductase [Rhodotorula diobovata]|uniref:Aldo/keto reductase n=1 Tax=Rhodotorula diobovata TaxID=5288 RepID=A0A5C5FK32_9BASI|nr:Aldo/keto reductase [Rhodotorula diobovata]
MSSPVRINDSLTVPPIGFGAMGFSQSYGVANDDQSKEVLRRAVDLGCTLWNSARIYGKDQHNEKLVGEVLREGEVRSKVVVVTKWGLKGTVNGMEVDGSADFCRQCIDESIENLGSAPDIYLLHRIDKKVPVEESVKAMEEARQAGKCKYIGLSAMSAKTLRRAAAVAKIDFVEMEWSPFETTIESNGVIEACQELGVKILAYSPLGKGFLTGRFRSFDDINKEGDMRGGGAFPRLTKDLFDHNFKLVEAFEKIAAAKGCTPGQLALAWDCQVYPGLIIPIPGTKSTKYLEENWAAKDIKLTDDEMQEIRRVMNENPIKGNQYNEQLQKLLDE